MDDLVKRWDVLMHPEGWSEESPEGEWVRYEDHAAALTEAQAEIARLREALIAVKHGGSLTYAKMTARAALEAKHG